MKRFVSVLLAGVVTVGLLTGCGSSAAKYKDGDYTAESKPDERGNYGMIQISIKDSKIFNVDFKEYVKGGALKDENYGKGNEENYKKAQAALAAAKTYSPKLVETQDVSKVDAVSGATSSNKLFKQLAEQALKSASEQAK